MQRTHNEWWKAIFKEVTSWSTQRVSKSSRIWLKVLKILLHGQMFG